MCVHSMHVILAYVLCWVYTVCEHIYYTVLNGILQNASNLQF